MKEGFDHPYSNNAKIVERMHILDLSAVILDWLLSSIIVVTGSVFLETSGPGVVTVNLLELVVWFVSQSNRGCCFF